MNLARRNRRCPAALIATGILAAPETAHANGRFPNAQQVVIGPGARSDVIALRVTFGVILSTDGGSTFHWICEEGLYSPFVPTIDYDPAVEVGANGAVFFSYENGVRYSTDGCQTGDVPGTERRNFQDLTSDPTGRVLYAIESTEGMTAALYRIDSTTLVSARYDTGLSDVRFFDTIEVAPSNPDRLYVTGRVGADFVPALYRSDDGGRTLLPVRPDAGPSDTMWVSAVDPHDPNTVYVRVQSGLSTELRRSRDGGQSFARIAETTDPMLGFAISDDGRTLWVGSIDTGLSRSDDGGDSFRPVSDLPVYCLRQHAGVLWACSDWVSQPFALGRSRDQGVTFEPVLQLTNYSQFQGPPVCATRSEGAAVCVARWPVLQRTFAIPDEPDAGPDDVPRDAAPPRDAGSDAGLMDVTTARDGGTSPPSRDSCDCNVPGRTTRPPGSAALTVLAALMIVRRRRAR